MAQRKICYWRAAVNRGRIIMKSMSTRSNYVEEDAMQQDDDATLNCAPCHHCCRAACPFAPREPTPEGRGSEERETDLVGNDESRDAAHPLLPDIEDWTPSFCSDLTRTDAIIQARAAYPSHDQYWQTVYLTVRNGLSFSTLAIPGGVPLRDALVYLGVAQSGYPVLTYRQHVPLRIHMTLLEIITHHGLSVLDITLKPRLVGGMDSGESAKTTDGITVILPATQGGSCRTDVENMGLITPTNPIVDLACWKPQCKKKKFNCHCEWRRAAIAKNKFSKEDCRVASEKWHAEKKQGKEKGKNKNEQKPTGNAHNTGKPQKPVPVVRQPQQPRDTTGVPVVAQPQAGSGEASPPANQPAASAPPKLVLTAAMALSHNPLDCALDESKTITETIRKYTEHKNLLVTNAMVAREAMDLDPDVTSIGVMDHATTLLQSKAKFEAVKGVAPKFGSQQVEMGQLVIEEDESTATHYQDAFATMAGFSITKPVIVKKNADTQTYLQTYRGLLREEMSKLTEEEGREEAEAEITRAWRDDVVIHVSSESHIPLEKRAMTNVGIPNIPTLVLAGRKTLYQYAMPICSWFVFAIKVVYGLYCVLNAIEHDTWGHAFGVIIASAVASYGGALLLSAILEHDLNTRYYYTLFKTRRVGCVWPLPRLNGTGPTRLSGLQWLSNPAAMSEDGLLPMGLTTYLSYMLTANMKPAAIYLRYPALVRSWCTDHRVPDELAAQFMLMVGEMLRPDRNSIV